MTLITAHGYNLLKLAEKEVIPETMATCFSTK